MITIDPERLMSDLRALAVFGKLGTGVDRTAFSKADIEARQWLLRRMEEGGLEARIDGVGNVIGRAPGNGPTVLIGSHTDSVPKGGWLDGSMGVIYGLEIARAALESGGGAMAVDVISFEDEEGTYKGLLGSGSFCGDISPENIKGARNIDGESLTDALAAHGLVGVEAERMEKGRYAAYLEAHIEQGPRLEAEGMRIGIVTGIVGIRRFTVVFKGQADHAGTTPMSMRKDAGAAAVLYAGAVFDGFRALARENTVWNLGNVAFEPGAANVVPSRASLVIEFRDTSGQVLDRLEEEVIELAGKTERELGVEATFERTAAIDPSQMDEALGAHMAAAATELGAQFMHMPSGAGHDAITLSRHLPSAMLFVPSIGGRSHDIVEDTDEADIVLGCQVMANSAARILGG
jgi:N-carbamoyl-L-amino-acid hydrolase